MTMLTAEIKPSDCIFALNQSHTHYAGTINKMRIASPSWATFAILGLSKINKLVSSRKKNGDHFESNRSLYIGCTNDLTQLFDLHQIKLIVIALIYCQPIFPN
jgi:hypothetical protein